MMGGVLTAAALGQSPLSWRRAVGESTPAAEHSQGPAWAYTAWLLADFLDSRRTRMAQPPSSPTASSPSCWRRMPSDERKS
jgi:hypothetical protein